LALPVNTIILRDTRIYLAGRVGRLGSGHRSHAARDQMPALLASWRY